MMIPSALRWLARLDRSYFFALSAFISAVAISLALAFTPIGERPDGSNASLFETEGAIVLMLLILPVLVVGTPLLSIPQTPGPRDRSHKINSIAAAVVLLGFVLISLPSFGLFYTPPLIFTVASSVSLYFGKDRKPGFDPAARRTARNVGEIRMSGNAPADSPSPNSVCRRRKGRNRKKR